MKGSLAKIGIISGIGVARGGRGSPLIAQKPMKNLFPKRLWFSVPLLSLACGLTADRKDLFFWSSPNFREKFGFQARDNLYFSSFSSLVPTLLLEVCPPSIQKRSPNKFCPLPPITTPKSNCKDSFFCFSSM